MNIDLQHAETREALLSGVGAAIATILLFIVLPRTYALDVIPLLLTLIASVYLGFAVIDGRQREIIIEVTVALMFIVIALLGMWISPYLWLVGYIGHGIWDMVHSKKGIQTNVPAWYKPLCMVYDWIIAIFLLFWL
jgi:hypothetical protein